MNNETQNNQDTSKPDQKEEKKPVQTSPQKPKKSLFSGLHFFGITLTEKILFAKHLSVMSGAGMTLLDSLELLKAQSASGAFTRIIGRLIAGVNEGQLLSTILEEFKDSFGELFINIVRVGEVSGTFSENLAYLAEELEKKRELRRKVVSALIYPIIILVATLGITGILTFLVFPKILPVFQSLRVELPLATRIMIIAANFLLAYFVWVFIGLLVLVAAIWLLFRIKKIRYLYHKSLLLIPIVSDMVQATNLADLSRTLGTLLKSGIKIVEALKITSQTLTNLVYREELEKIGEGVARGETISGYMVKKTRNFPLIFSQMIRVGENTGHLDNTLLYLAGFYEKELDSRTKTFSSVLEPLLLLTMGVIVGFIALAIITPIYEITQNLGPR